MRVRRGAPRSDRRAHRIERRLGHPGGRVRPGGRPARRLRLRTVSGRGFQPRIRAHALVLGPYQGHLKRPSDGKGLARRLISARLARRAARRRLLLGGVRMVRSRRPFITRRAPARQRRGPVLHGHARLRQGFDRYIDLAKDKIRRGLRPQPHLRNHARRCDRRADGALLRRAGNTASAAYDMVVLSVGLKPNAACARCTTRRVRRSGTASRGGRDGRAPHSREAILACGAASGPRTSPKQSWGPAPPRRKRRGWRQAAGGRRGLRRYSKRSKKLPAATFRSSRRAWAFSSATAARTSRATGREGSRPVRQDTARRGHASDLVSPAPGRAELIAQRIKRLNLTRVIVASCSRARTSRCSARCWPGPG